MQRRVSRVVRIGDISIGGDMPVAVQSMLSRPAGDVDANVAQARELEEAGCAILRVSVPTVGDVRLVTMLKQSVEIPIVADIHFDYRIALACIDAGVDKIRINPGNIGGQDRVKTVVSACKTRDVPIRIGVNGGSLEKELLEQYGGPVPEALVESAMRHVRLLEEESFFDIVISIKSSHVPTMIRSYELLAAQSDYPLHLGVTEAGTYTSGVIKNALGIGSLLLEGIGDTLRVSLTDEPVCEIEAGYEILRAAGYPVDGPEIISCPTCGRTNIPVAEIANEVRLRAKNLKMPIKIAVMGCVVNGIGEGKEADIGIAGGKDSAVLFVNGKKVRTIHGNYIDELMMEIKKVYGG